MKKDKFTDLKHQESEFLKEIGSFSSPEKERIFRALFVAKKEHADQLRHSGEPYVIHPLRAALSLIRDLGIRETDSVCALLLHDVVEDGSFTYQEAKEIFGPEVSRMVRGLTRERPEEETEKEKKENKIRHIKKLAKEEKDIQILKLCDVLDNARSWSYIPKDNPNYKKIPRWKNELKHYLPIAKKVNQKLFSLLKERL